MIVKAKMIRDWAKVNGISRTMDISGKTLWDMYCEVHPGSCRVFPDGIFGEGDKLIATTKDVRQWARKVGLQLGTNGYIPVRVWDLYLEQHPEAHN